MMVRNRSLLFAGIILVTGGFFFSGWVAWSIFKPAPQNTPFTYVMVEEGNAGAFPDLGIGGEEGKENSDLVLRKYELRIEKIDKPIVVFHTASRGGEPPVLLDWKNNLAEPVLTLTSTISETNILAEAIVKHASTDATFLGWWDTSRRIQLLAGVNVLFNENLVLPVLVPSMWMSRRLSVQDQEREFWKAPPVGRSAKQFDVFVDALLSDEVAGTAKLRQLTGEGEAYIVLHISDIYKIGAIAPERFSVGYKDFTKTGGVHGLAKRIKGWIKKQGHKAYAILPIGDRVQRVFFLTDETSMETLIARMLPFDTSNPFKLAGLKVIYQHGGYWVYQMPLAAVAAEGEVRQPDL